MHLKKESMKVNINSFHQKIFRDMFFFFTWITWLIEYILQFDSIITQVEDFAAMQKKWNTSLLIYFLLYQQYFHYVPVQGKAL